MIRKAPFEKVSEDANNRLSIFDSLGYRVLILWIDLINLASHLGTNPPLCDK